MHFKIHVVPVDYFSLIYKNIRMEGFMVMRWNKEWFQGIEKVRDYIIQVINNVK